MTADDLTRLRAVAEAADPNSICRVCEGFTDPGDIHGTGCIEWFHRTFDPPTVAALIDRVERAERERNREETLGHNWLGADDGQ